jgi:hypothetical protein
MVEVPQKRAMWSSSGASPALSRTRLTKFQSIGVLSRRMPEQEAAAFEAHENNDKVSEDKGICDMPYTMHFG